jgi:16S rRNA processing protein RimM
LVVGKLRRPHGLRGEILMDILTDFPERLLPGETVYIGENYRSFNIRTRRPHKGGLLVTFDPYHDPESVGSLRNLLVYVRTDDRPPLPEGEYYHHQLLGLHVLSDEGQSLGHLIKILDTGANDVYVVRPESGSEILLPAIDSVILNIDLERGEILVHLLPGLLPE